MINWNGSSGAAVVFITLFLSVWIVGAEDMETVTEFEISEMGAAVMPAAVEDQQAVVAEILDELEAVERIRKRSIDEGDSEGSVERWSERVSEMEIVHWQAVRVLGLLKHLARINQGRTVRGVV